MTSAQRLICPYHGHHSGRNRMMTNDECDRFVNNSEDAYLKSMFYEQLVEHVFISEVLQELWYYFGKTAEVLRSEIDSSGYDVVIECDGILRHIQLKTSKSDAKASGQKVNVALADKPSGCIVWIFRQEDRETHRMKLSYRYFGGDAGKPLPSLNGFKVAKHTKGNAEGVKKERTAIKVVPKSEFSKEIKSTRELLGKLFGLNQRASQHEIEQVEAAADEIDEEDTEQ